MLAYIEANKKTQSVKIIAYSLMFEISLIWR